MSLDRRPARSAPVARCALLASLLAACSGAASPDASTDASVVDDLVVADATVTDAGGNVPYPPPGGLVAAVARMCVLQASCGPSRGGLLPRSDCAELGIAFVSFLSNATDLLGDSVRRQVYCAATADSCAAYGRCVAPGYDTAYCATHPGASCDGTHAVDCNDLTGGVPGVVDCAAYGLTCETVAGDGGLRTRCAGGTPATCPADAGTRSTRCDGTRIVRCEQGTSGTAYFDCARLSTPSTCAVTSIGAMCIPSATPSCASGSGSRCDGERAVACQDGRELGVDCAAVGAHCVARPATDGGAPRASCESAGTECDNDTTDDGCTDGRLALCIFGHRRSVDCRSLGFASCGTVSGDAGTTFGHVVSCQ